MITLRMKTENVHLEESVKQPHPKRIQNGNTRHSALHVEANLPDVSA